MTKKKWLLLGTTLFLMATVAYCTPNAWNSKIDFELTGQVFDYATKQPIEGAYVIAVYNEQASGYGAVTTYCVKTKGMLSGKDGSFNFPVEKLDGRSPFEVYAIKPGYYFERYAAPSERVWKKQNRETYFNRHVYLTKQDEAKPQFLYGFFRCERPNSIGASDAAVEFLKIKYYESKRLGREWQILRDVQLEIAEQNKFAIKPIEVEQK